MLRVWLTSGEEVASLPVENLTDVKNLKLHLQGLCGLTRFRQRLLHEGVPLYDTVTLDVPMDLQLVLLPFTDASDSDMFEMTAAATWPDHFWIEELLQRPQDPNLLDGEGYAALHVACRQGHIENVKLLLEAGADQNSIDRFGQFALNLAVQNSSSRTLSLCP
ncbi:AKT1 [Symbiodinium pilosum]|uniref:AKT1 protein n=1 Tax=Symbiodinium pilosum TaxID=2952 RepID=A0A812PKT0_SYMPI|nr:AKT1 [Symbiodinium pilosum]